MTPPTETRPTKQQLFNLYFTAILIDLTVLNLFAEYWDKVEIDTFTTSLFAAILLQLMLKLTLEIEHRLADYFHSKSGTMAKVMHYGSAWLVLFGSKFVMLEAVDFVLSGSMRFLGVMHGVLTFIVVAIAMLVAERLIVKFYFWLGE